MSSKNDSNATYCSEVEELLKATPTIKCCVPKFSTQALRRSQRILQKTKTTYIDHNDYCLCDFVGLEKANKRKAICSSENAVKPTKVSQEIFSTEDLLEEQDQGFCNEFTCKQAEQHLPSGNFKQHLDVPLDLSKKSKELIKETSRKGEAESKKHNFTLDYKQTPKEYSNVGDSKLPPNDCDKKNSKNKKLGKYPKTCKNGKQIRRSNKNYDKNVAYSDSKNYPSRLGIPHNIEEPSNKTADKNIYNDLVSENNNSSSTLKTGAEPLIVNTICKTNVEKDTAKIEEIKTNKTSTTSILDTNQKANISGLNNCELQTKKKELISQERNKNTAITKSQKRYKPPNRGVKSKMKTSNKGIAIPKAKSSTSAKTKKPIRNSQMAFNIFKNSDTVSKNSEISAHTIQDVRKSIKSNKRLKFSNKRNNFENLRSLDDSEKLLIEQNYRKSLLQINSDEILTKTRDWGKLTCKRRHSQPKKGTVPMKKAKQSMLPNELFKNFASFQKTLTPAPSTEDVLSKSIFTSTYPPHFKYQLPPETAFNRNFSIPPAYVVTPDDTPSVEFLDSSSSSPSLPESLCELLQTKDIKDILNVDKVVYRLYDYHIEGLALILNLNQEYLRKILDKIINIRPHVLRNMNKAVKEPFVMDQDLFTNTPDESATSGDVVFNSQESKEISNIQK